MMPSRLLNYAGMVLVGLLFIAPAAMAADPGDVFPELSEASDQKAGSLLVFNIYTSSTANPNVQNTSLSITNTNSSNSAAVHLFFVDGNSCSIADRFLCLTPQQTTTLFAGDQDPGITGFLVAVAVDLITGAPERFNYLIGSEFVKFSTGHFAGLGAEAYSKLTDTNQLTLDRTLAGIFFDGLLLPGSYNRLGRVLAISSIAARPDGNDTLLIINNINGSYQTSANIIGPVFGLLYNEAEESFSFTFPAGCQLRATLSNVFPRTTPRFEVIIPAGQVGWLKLWAVFTVGTGLTGAVINFNPNAATSQNAFNGGRNLHKLTLANTGLLLMPSFPPNC
jgi:hypothetical protein